MTERVMSERARWLLLVLSLIVAFCGLAFGGILYTSRVDRHRAAETARVEHDAQQDFCDLMRVFDDPAAPPPSTERGRRQVEAIRSYLARRC